MDAASVGARSIARPIVRSRRLLSLVADERLVEQISRGNEAAFEVVFERYAPGLLAFCRHMLSSREEAEDAVQLTFAAAHSDLLRRSDRVVALKPWLFTIARNRCLSILRARREPPAELGDLPTSGLGEQVEERAELRQLLADVRELPDEQRAALLLAEVSDMSHAQVAAVLGCEVARVKALVFRARGALMDRRRARETPCVEIQEQLANLSGGSLRRTPLRMHLRECAACRSYREEVRNQRKVLAAALPVVPSLGLKSSVLAALGIGSGSAGGGLAVGLSSVAGAFGGGALAKVAVVAVLAGGTAIAVPDALESRREAHAPDPGAEKQSSRTRGIGLAGSRARVPANAAASAALDAGCQPGRKRQGARRRRYPQARGFARAGQAAADPRRVARAREGRAGQGAAAGTGQKRRRQRASRAGQESRQQRGPPGAGETWAGWAARQRRKWGEGRQQRERREAEAAGATGSEGQGPGTGSARGREFRTCATARREAQAQDQALAPSEEHGGSRQATARSNFRTSTALVRSPG